PVLPPDFKWGQVIGIFADTRGHVWTSSSSRIAEWDPQGKLVQSWDARGPDGNWSTIHGMFVDHNGFVWTNARESNLTVKFSREGKVVLVIGKFNETAGSNDTVQAVGDGRREGRRQVISPQARGGRQAGPPLGRQPSDREGRR
ncbi:MAG TPA: hypothetical protein VFD43_11940, partial [Planctomycetota bacterium]|nr:hypothetical protein [Planctomycetota bacterium]